MITLSVCVRVKQLVVIVVLFDVDTICMHGIKQNGLQVSQIVNLFGHRTHAH